ncbi:MAG: hypothetical protein MJZ78_00395 [Bacteroidales bacterium]|nr:hypothetical protein [Bacteroidales bacterium]
MGILKDLNIIVGKTTKAGSMFENLFSGQTFKDIEYSKPSDYVNKYWKEYTSKRIDGGLNGQIFEIIISTLLYRENLLPFYIQAKVAFVPNVYFDIILYSLECGPISLSLKTSLRERYKQADLEAIALKYVHRKAKSYLLTMEEREGKSVKDKIKTGDVIGIDDVVICSLSDIDDLISKLHSIKLSLAGSVDIIESTQIVK